MGWSTGSEIFSRIMTVLNDTVEDLDSREKIYLELIPIFEDADCDTMDELFGEDEAYDNAYRKLHKGEDDYAEYEDVDDITEVYNVFDEDEL